MSSTAIDGGLQPDELRERLPAALSRPPKAESLDTGQMVQALNKQEAASGKRDEEKKTYGRTPGGKVFIVPQTHDMVSQLLSPTQPKNLSDLAVIVVLASFIGMLVYLPNPVSVPLFAIIFLFWRICYNAGIGYLLYEQSNHRKLTAWAKRSRLFENPSTSENPHPALYKLLKRELEAKIPHDYSFDTAPLEYNTWLVFRRLVDLILMSDFTAYCCFAIACCQRPTGENILLTIGRWVCGIALVLFNLWVKLDAHRVVKDYAWYWGDFFYLIDQELTFDGVFEMAPHPMYSVGYAGYYGISLIAASYKVLFISIVAHAAQFAFLLFVENPHIDKTYNAPPKTVKKRLSMQPLQGNGAAEGSTLQEETPITAPQATIRDMIGPQNMDFCRVPDVSAFLVQLLLYSAAILSPNNRSWQAYFVLLAFLSRLWYSLGIGFILDRQSNKKKWTRHFLKYGDTAEEAWRQWKGIYHLSMTMTYTTFICAAWKMYHMPADWTYGMALLRHVFGAALIALQLWTIVSIYESLGDFGWFFGDFFFDQKLKLTYSGIYRFLNNPERVIGLAGLWGVAIITWSKTIFFLALLSHVLTLAFIQFVERPHMQKLYGETLRQDSGVSKSIKRSLPEPLSKWKGSVDRAIENSADYVEELVDSVKPIIAASVDSLVRDTRSMLQQYPSRIALSRSTQNVPDLNPADYSLEISGTPVSAASVIDRVSGREGETGQKPLQYLSDNAMRPRVLEYGAPIRVKWEAPANHNSRDWIGLYVVGDNPGKEVSRLSSQGRWVATTKDVWNDSTADRGILLDDHVAPDADGTPVRRGEVVFSGDKLWWTQGMFEFRLHHAGGHNVLAISPPFEVTIPKFDEDAVPRDDSGDAMRRAAERALLPIVRNCFDQDADVAPAEPAEDFGAGLEREGRYARRVVFAVHMMFGIEFAPAVVVADGNVRNLAWRITNAKRVLQPYSMSSSGRATPS